MSRCFPFPPPGYEKKTRIDDTDLLTKEKHKEKKHKKDKKDKEKRESKEKKDKERSKEKNREKKDRKEKYKDKDRDRDKEKNQTSDEKRVEGQPENSNVEKLGPSSLQNNEIKNSKYVQELARRIRDEDRAMGSQIVQKVTVTEQRRAELPGRVVENKIGERSEEKEKANNKKEDVRKLNGQRNHHVEARGLENTALQKFSGMDQRRVEGIAKPMEKKDVGKQMEGKEKSKHKERDSKGDKHKDRDREKKSKSKDKDRDKEKKKEEKAKEIGELSKELPKLKEGGKNSLDICNIKTPNILKTSRKSSAGEGNLGKRKELEINGFLHDNGLWPNKLPKPVSSSHPAMENGRKLEPCQTAIQVASERQGAATNNCKGNIKENKINGLIEVQRPNSCSTRPSSSSVQVYENGEASAKPPHPDLKYLSQILSVPKMEEFSDFDDQEWLFSSNSLQSKKPKVGSSGVDGTRQVWAEALRIESADVTALPYVIPY